MIISKTYKDSNILFLLHKYFNQIAMRISLKKQTDRVGTLSSRHPERNIFYY